MAYDLETVKRPDDPRRCEGTKGTAGEQCWHVAVQDDRFCVRCGRGHGVARLEKKTVKGYLLAQADDRARLAQVSEELEPVKALRESIAMLTMLIEKRWNAMKGEGDLLQACGPLNQMLQNMERLVTSCHKIEQNLGMLLARQAILMLAKRMVEVIIEELEGIDDYEHIVDRITDRLFALIRGANNDKQQTTVVALPVLPAPEQPPRTTTP